MSKGRHSRRIGKVGEDLAGALDCLAANSWFCEALAENLYWASCEGFLQSSWLAAFNKRSRRYVADRERSIIQGAKPDLLVLERRSEEEWWKARESRHPSRREILQEHCRGVVEFKVAWATGKGAASTSAKAKATKDDAESLRGMRLPSCDERYVACLVASRFDDPDGKKRPRMEETIAAVTQAVSPYVQGLPRRWDLLNEFASPRWPKDTRATAALMMWRVSL